MTDAVLKRSRTNRGDPLAALLSEVPVSMFQCSEKEVKAVEIPSHSTVGAAIELLSAQDASLAVVVDSDSWEVQADSLRGAPSLGCCLGLVQLSWLVLWSLEQADRAEHDDQSASQPGSPVPPAAELAADAVNPDGVDVPLLLAWKWTGEDVGREPNSDAAAVPLGDQTPGHHTHGDSLQDFKEAMSHFACWHVKVTSLARTRYWQPFLPLSSSSSVMDAISLVAQHGPSVIPLISSLPFNTSSGPSPALPAPVPSIQGYLSQQGLLSALSKMSGLQWFDELLAQRTLSQLSESCMEASVASSMPLAAALLQLCRTGHAALPIVDQTGIGATLVGHLEERDAVRLVKKPGLFLQRWKVSVGEYVGEFGPGVRTLDDSVRHEASPGEQGTPDAAGQLEASSSSRVAEADQGGTEGASEEHGALVAGRGATVSSALQAMAQGGYTYLFVVGGANERLRGRRNGTDVNKMSPRTPLEGTTHARDATREASSTGQESRDASGEVSYVLHAKDFISLLSPTSSLELGVQWKGFFENALGLCGDVERTRKTFFKDDSSESK
ncbi:hypothetical protein KFL_005480110 [Klebsormidium nitens]|uniref:CBS domain-containing protein n=1 Tax=Klebsormidium nitens TaxID=105231 RepID=A0A1Y1IM38_KLENI|nr:hypothetical protein KFL_005480110 [Klebsormidium nitens]|eukprot:GAQ89667.1 hypothetical protein KFL_005480110 [Klebsormidium nitens]